MGVAEAGGELVERVLPARLEDEQLDAAWWCGFPISGGGGPEDAGGVDGREVAAEPDREASVGGLEFVEADGLVQLPVGVGVSRGTAGADDHGRRAVVSGEAFGGVGLVDLDEREMRALAGVAAAAAPAAEEHADVYVGAGGESGDRLGGELGRVAGVKVWRMPSGIVERISISRPAGSSPARIRR